MKLTLMISLLTSAFFLCTNVTWAEGVVEGFEGGAVVLPCTATIKGNLRWRVVNNLILIRNGGQVLIEQSTPWKDVISLVGSSNNLSISNISHQRDDGRTFTCEDTTESEPDKQETTVRVLVRIKGVRIEQASEGQVTLTEGTPKTLTCKVTGNPNPNSSYSWMVDNGGETGQGSSYSLTADRSMRSVRCTATNKYSNGSVLSTKEATATLNVLYLDTPSATTAVNVTENETATLRCSAQGNPQPTFEWRMSESAEVKSTLTVYRIENVQRSASGEYTCSVTNSVGSRQTTVQLVVQYPPDVTVTYDNISHTLTCTAEGIPDSYTFSPWEHRVGETLIRTLGTETSGTSVTHTLPDTLTYADTGDYVCTVTNGIKSGQTGRFYVAPPTPAVFENHSQTLVIGLGKTETISVPFYARPSSGSVQVKWEKTEESDALESHREKAGPVRLVVYGQEVSLPGIVTTLTLTNVSPPNEGEYSVTVTCNINGVAKTSKTSFYVNVTEISDFQSVSPMGPIAGGVAGGLVLIAVIILVIVVLRRRSGGTGGAGGKDEKTSVNEQLVGGSEKSAFSDPRWRQADAEVAENDLYGGSPFPTKLPPQDKRPPKPVRTFEHNSIGEPSHSTAPKDGGQQLEMVENTMYASVDPKTKSQKNGATKPKKGKPVTPAKPSKPAKTQVPIDDSYEVTDFTNTASGTNNNNPTVARTQQLNYPEVSFENKKKTPKTDPAASPTEYASIRFRKP